jgi:hypothetical protein
MAAKNQDGRHNGGGHLGNHNNGHSFNNFQATELCSTSNESTKKYDVSG